MRKRRKGLVIQLDIRSVSCKCDRELGCQQSCLLTQTAQIYLKLHHCEEELEAVLGTSSSSVPRGYRQYFPEYRRIRQAKSMAVFSGPSLWLGPICLLWSWSTFYIWAGLPVKFPLKEKSADAQEKYLETETTIKQLETTADTHQTYYCPKSDG